jgi:chorismate synthase
VLSRLRFLTAGESHGPALTAILEGMPAGLALGPADIDPDLARRRGIGVAGHPYPGASARMGVERDAAEILAGVLAGLTTGAPIAVLVRNRDHANWKGRALEPLTVPRPGHADLAGAVKYGYGDLRLSLERSSARETAARVAVGAICRKLLAGFGIRVGSYVSDIGGVRADLTTLPLEERLERAAESDLRCPSVTATTEMAARIREIARVGDTAGGVFEVIALGVPPGLGSHVHWDRRLSGRLGAALLSIPAVKGVEIAEAFESARRPGTEVQDEIDLDEGTSALVRPTNRAGGLEGGITNGQPLVLRAAMKPISTTRTPLRSIDLATGGAAPTGYERSDICAVPRAAVVGEAMVSVVLADALLEKLGGDSIAEMKPRFEALRRMRLEEMPARRDPALFWP